MKRILIASLAISLLSACAKGPAERTTIQRPAPRPVPSASPIGPTGGDRDEPAPAPGRHAIDIVIQDGEAAYALVRYLNDLEFVDGAYRPRQPLQIAADDAQWARFIVTIPAVEAPDTPMESRYSMGCTVGTSFTRRLTGGTTGPLAHAVYGLNRWYEFEYGDLSPLFELCGAEDVAVEITLVTRIAKEPFATFVVRFHNTQTTNGVN